MMSAKTVLTDTALTPPAAAAAPGSTAAPSAPGAAPSEFQHLLADAAPLAAEPTLADTLPPQPLAQLLALKQQQAAKLAAATPGSTVQPVKSTETTPADLLKLIKEGAALLPQSVEGDAASLEAAAEEIPDTEVAPEIDEDMLTEWMEAVLPHSVFAPQAGSANPTAGGITVSTTGTDLTQKPAGPPLPVPASLLPQAGQTAEPGKFETQNPVTAVAATPGVPPGVVPGGATHREIAMARQNPMATLAAALQGKPDKGEPEKPASDSWMNAMGDLTTRRGADAAPLSGPKIQTPVQDARWADALAQRLVLMARHGETTASLRLVPQDLGPLEIQISVRDGEANVHFGAAHQETRAALEASMPRLRELLSAQGLQLANASVSHQSSGDRSRPERSAATGAVGAVEDAEATPVKVVSTSLLDIYA